MLAIPWGHHCLIVNKIKDPITRRWYIARAIDHGWSRGELTRATECDEHGRVGRAATNFDRLCRPIGWRAHERSSRTRTSSTSPPSASRSTRPSRSDLVEHGERFLLEPGRGFAFGRQVDLTVDGEDFRLDPLFHHPPSTSPHATCPPDSPQCCRRSRRSRPRWAHPPGTPNASGPRRPGPSTDQNFGPRSTHSVSSSGFSHHWLP